MEPKIHGMGRILFQDYEYMMLRVSRVSYIPGGPALNMNFIREGTLLLSSNWQLELPPLLVTPKEEQVVFDREYWAIDGRHRLESYKMANRSHLPAIVGRGMIIMPKLDTV